MKAALPTTSSHDHHGRPRLPTRCEEAREWCVCEHTRCGRWVRGWTGRGRGCPPVGLVGDGSGAGEEDKVQGGGAGGSRQLRERKEHKTWMRGGRQRLRRWVGWAGRRVGGRADWRASLSHRWRHFPALDACRPSPCAAAPPPLVLYLPAAACQPAGDVGCLCPAGGPPIESPPRLNAAEACRVAGGRCRRRHWKRRLHLSSPPPSSCYP